MHMRKEMVTLASYLYYDFCYEKKLSHNRTLLCPSLCLAV